MRIHAFHGQRFSTKHGNPGDWAAPPFDQINKALGEELRRDPHHFVHLTRPDPSDSDPHRRAASTLEAWIADGHVTTETEPALYRYETRLANGASRLGLCALVEVGRGDIRPHEQTVDKTVDERLALLRRIQTDLEPVFLLVDDGGRLNDLLSEQAGEPLMVADDGAGNTHSIRAITGGSEAYAAALADVDGLIADGHHRTKVATRYADETGAAGDTAAGCKLVVIVSLASDGLTIDPIHRAWVEDVDFEPMRAFTALTEVVDDEALHTAVAFAPQPAIGVWRRDGQPEVWQLDADAIRATTDDPAPDLAVALLHAAFPALGWDPASATDGTITYRSDPGRLAGEMRDGAFSLSVWLPPMTPEAFGRALEVLPVLPPKSTRFLPKLVSGMVWSRHDRPIL